MAVETKTYGVGIIGTGRISGAHARSSQMVDRARLVAASEVDEARGKQFSDRWGCEVVKDYHQLLERDDIDIVVLCLPHWLHCPIGIDVANAGKHLLVEKPLANTVEECDQMIAAARKNHVKLLTGHTEQFLAPNVKARQMILNGEVGDPVMATDEWYKPFGLAARPPWFVDRSQGGGMWLMNGAHMIDRLTFVLNSKVAAVKAYIGTRYNPIKADDCAMAFLEMESGVPATIAHTGFKDHPGAGINQPGGVVEISCTEAMLKIDNRRDLYRTVPDEEGKGSRWEQVPIQQVNTAAVELESLIQSIERDTPPACTPEQARHIVAVMTACEESSRTHREVRLDA